MADINFYNDFQKVIAKELSDLGHSPEEGENLDAVLMRYLNFIRKIPPVIKWTVNISKELNGKSLDPQIELGLNKFVQEAKLGKSLRPYLSTLSDKPDYNDLMFHEWNIIHFHLGTTPHQKYQKFVARTSELLFAFFDAKTSAMYLIDIHPHNGGFTNQDLIKIIEDNWSGILARFKFNGILEVDLQLSDSDIDSFRKAGVTTMIQNPSGNFFTPMGGGITLARTGVTDTVEVDMIKSSLSELNKWFIQQRDTIEADLSKYNTNTNWDNLRFQVKFFEKPVKIEETTTGHIITSSINIPITIFESEE